jgi:hypothetical protein
MIYEFECSQGHQKEVYEHARDDLGCDTILCHCGHTMSPVPSYGRGLLYFEEGRGRWIHNMGHEPVYITSKAQHIREMKKHGVAEAPAIPDKTKFSGRASTKGRWV